MLMYSLTGCTSTKDRKQNEPSTPQQSKSSSEPLTRLQPDSSPSEIKTTEQIKNTNIPNIDFSLENLRQYRTMA